MSDAQPVAAKRRHIPAIDGLRGIAVAGVLLFHDGRLTGGFLGVDMFFALSGFLITSLLIEERERTGGVRLGAFWERRARRLLPAVLAFLVAIVPLMRWFGTTAQVDAARRGVWPALLYVANWDQIRGSTDYWALFSDPSPLTHLWSLAVEEQFYVVWPFVAFWCLRRERWRTPLAAVAGIGFVVSVVLMAVLYDPANPSRVYMGTDTRAFSILIGALVALAGLSRRVEPFALRHPRVVEFGQAALLVAVLLSWSQIDGASSQALYRGGLVLHSAACAVLVATVGLTQPNWVMRLLSLRPLLWLGAISYGLYLWHWPVFIIVNAERTGLDPWLLTVSRWAVSLTIAGVSYHVLETPIRYRKALTDPRLGLAAIGGAVAVLAAIVVVIPAPDRTIASVDPTAIALPPTPTTEPATAAPTADTVAPSPAATSVPTDEPPTDEPPATDAPAPPSTSPVTAPVETIPKRLITSVAWEGDSVAYDSAPGVMAALSAAGLQADAYTFLGTGLVETETSKPFELFLPPLRANPPDVVMYMFSGWDDQLPAADQVASLNAYADAVSDLGAALVLLEPPPVDPTRHEDEHSVMLAAARERAARDPDGVFVLDSAALWGPFADDVNGDGIPERKPDGVHICPAGAALFGHWLAFELTARFDGVSPADPTSWAAGEWTTDPRYDDPPGACVAR